MATSSIPHAPGIYKITCTANGKIYIGSSIDLAKRWIKHRAELRGNYHINKYLQRSWNKHGEDTFIFEIIELVMPWSLLDRENYWLNKLRPFQPNGFNSNQNATKPPSRKGCKLTDEHRAKISKGLKGKRNSLGKKHRPEAWFTKSRAMKGHPVSEKFRAMISVIKSKAYIVTSPDGKEIAIKNLRKFCQDNNFPYRTMSSVANGRKNHWRGWKCKKL